MPTPAGDRVLGLLSPKQRQICSLLVEEVTNKAIAWRMGTSEQVIKNYTKKMFDLTGTGNRLELVIWFMRNGVLPCPCENHQEK